MKTKNTTLTVSQLKDIVVDSLAKATSANRIDESRAGEPLSKYNTKYFKIRWWDEEKTQLYASTYLKEENISTFSLGNRYRIEIFPSPRTKDYVVEFHAFNSDAESESAIKFTPARLLDVVNDIEKAINVLKSLKGKV